VTTVPVIIVKKINGRALSLNHLIADDIIAKVVIVSPHRKKKKRVQRRRLVNRRRKRLRHTHGTPCFLSISTERAFGVRNTERQKEGNLCVRLCFIACSEQPVPLLRSHRISDAKHNARAAPDAARAPQARRLFLAGGN
jgi:hypothetical protein